MSLTYANAHRHGGDIAAVEIVNTTGMAPSGVIVRGLMIEIGKRFASGELEAGEIHIVIQGAAAYFRDIADALDQKSTRCIAVDGKVVDS
jgi:hypothetical protein